MNPFEHLVCSSSLWRYFSERYLMPWVLAGQPLGERALEIGAGYGAGTRYLSGRVKLVTALDYDPRSTTKLKVRSRGDAVEIVCGDGAQLPFAAEQFSSVLAILVLHHLKSAELQDRMLGEASRVLRPGGVLVGFEIEDRWTNRIGHVGSTFTPFTSSAAFRRLAAAGFGEISVDMRSGAFRFRAAKTGRA